MQSPSSRTSNQGIRTIRACLGSVTLIAALFVVGLLLVAAPAAADRTTMAMSVDEPPPTVTLNDFVPEDRDLSDCLSALPKPGCGSESRGGWSQTMVMLLIVVGLAIIVWRIRAGIKRAAAQSRDQADHSGPSDRSTG